MTGQMRPVNGYPEELQRTGSGKRRRWLLALDPIIEGGRHRKRARAWDADDEPITVALLGEVTIGLSQIKSAPAEIDIDAYPLFRDARRARRRGPHVEMPSGVLRGDLRNAIPAVPDEHRKNVIRIHGHKVLYGSRHSGFDLRRSGLGSSVRQGAAVSRSCVRDGSRTEGGCCCQDRGRAR